jgi:hypothetical protein
MIRIQKFQFHHNVKPRKLRSHLVRYQGPPEEEHYGNDK